MYQCVVSNSEGVVFSRVSKVKMLARRSRARALDTTKVNIITVMMIRRTDEPFLR